MCLRCLFAWCFVLGLQFTASHRVVVSFRSHVLPQKRDTQQAQRELARKHLETVNSGTFEPPPAPLLSAPPHSKPVSSINGSTELSCVVECRESDEEEITTGEEHEGSPIDGGVAGGLFTPPTVMLRGVLTSTVMKQTLSQYWHSELSDDLAVVRVLCDCLRAYLLACLLD